MFRSFERSADDLDGAVGPDPFAQVADVDHHDDLVADVVHDRRLGEELDRAEVAVEGDVRAADDVGDAARGRDPEEHEGPVDAGVGHRLEVPDPAVGDHVGAARHERAHDRRVGAGDLRHRRHLRAVDVAEGDDRARVLRDPVGVDLEAGRADVHGTGLLMASRPSPPRVDPLAERRADVVGEGVGEGAEGAEAVLGVDEDRGRRVGEEVPAGAGADGAQAVGGAVHLREGAAGGDDPLHGGEVLPLHDLPAAGGRVEVGDDARVAPGADGDGLLAEPAGERLLALRGGEGREVVEVRLGRRVARELDDVPRVDVDAEVALDGPLGARLRLDEAGVPLGAPLRHAVDVGRRAADVEDEAVARDLGEELGGAEDGAGRREDPVPRERRRGAPCPARGRCGG